MSMLTLIIRSRRSSKRLSIAIIIYRPLELTCECDILISFRSTWKYGATIIKMNACACDNYHTFPRGGPRCLNNTFRAHFAVTENNRKIMLKSSLAMIRHSACTYRFGVSCVMRLQNANSGRKQRTNKKSLHKNFRTWKTEFQKIKRQCIARCTFRCESCSVDGPVTVC